MVKCLDEENGERGYVIFVENLLWFSFISLCIEKCMYY